MVARTVLSPTARPLLVTDDTYLLDEVLNLAAQAGTEVEVAPDVTAARPRYPTAPLVLVGAELAGACTRADLPRRSGVLLVAGTGRPEPPWAEARRLGVDNVVILPDGASWLVDRFAMVGDRPASGQVIAVVGGRGGAGTSVLAAGLAMTATRSGRRALLIDGDPLGGGLDLLLGWEHLEGLRWPDLADTAGAVDATVLVGALPRRGELAVLSCERGDGLTLSAEAMATAIGAGRRGSDVVVIDVPRRFDDAASTAIHAADRVLLVLPAELRACAAATRVAAVLAEHGAPVEVVVRGPAPGRLRAREIAHALGLPLAGLVRTDPALARALERGEPPAAGGTGPLADFCHQLLDRSGSTDRAA